MQNENIQFIETMAKQKRQVHPKLDPKDVHCCNGNVKGNELSRVLYYRRLNALLLY